MFKYLLRQADGEPPEPAAGFVTAVPNWTVGDTFLLGHGERFRILAIETEISDVLLERGSTACSRSSRSTDRSTARAPTHRVRLSDRPPDVYGRGDG
jgi:hypothetical protein